MVSTHKQLTSEEDLAPYVVCVMVNSNVNTPLVFRPINMLSSYPAMHANHVHVYHGYVMQ